MKLTKDQVLSFLKDDKTLASTEGIEYIESNIILIDTDEAEFTLVVKINEKFFLGKVKYYDAGGSFSEGDYTYKPGFFDDFDGMELQEVHSVPKIKYEWEPKN